MENNNEHNDKPVRFTENGFMTEPFALGGEGTEGFDPNVVDFANPTAVIPPGEIVFKTPTGKYICSVCGYVYDPAEHDGVAFEDLPAERRCLRCKQPKEKFNRA